MPDQISPHQISEVVLGTMCALFAGYGVWQLALAYRSAALRAWTERAAIASGSLFVAAVFAAMTVQVLDAPHPANLAHRPAPAGLALRPNSANLALRPNSANLAHRPEAANLAHQVDPQAVAIGECTGCTAAANRPTRSNL